MNNVRVSRVGLGACRVEAGNRFLFVQAKLAGFVKFCARAAASVDQRHV